MRDIKFRAYIKIDEWEGYYYPNDENDYIQFILFQDGFSVVDCNDNYLKEDEFIIEQYTGLKDKNDKEIYEGDIVSDGDIEDRETYVVESMLELYYAVIYSEQHSGNGYFTRKDIEIIGNIHEELL